MLEMILKSAFLSVAVLTCWTLTVLDGTQALSPTEQNSIPSNGTVTKASTDSTATSEKPGNDALILNQQTCDCGLRTRLASRIVGGERADIQKYPWMASITAFGEPFCGGALISERYVLTAAHCFKLFLDNWKQAPDIGVRLGITERDAFGGNYGVEQVIVHDKYNKRVSGVNDIALIRLATPAVTSAKVRPICLPAEGDSFTNVFGTVAGWGVLTHDGGPSKALREVLVRILSFDECRKVFEKYNKTLSSDNVCAGGQKDKDACQGDSGSPLFINDNNVFKIVGVVSWGLKCGLENVPGAYTSIAAHLKWIRSHVLDLCKK